MKKISSDLHTVEAGAQEPVAWRWRSIFNKEHWTVSIEKPSITNDQYILEPLFAAPASHGATALERAADAIDAARYAHPEHPRERPHPFAEAHKTDREYAFRLARAALTLILREEK